MYIVQHDQEKGNTIHTLVLSSAQVCELKSLFHQHHTEYHKQKKDVGLVFLKVVF